MKLTIDTQADTKDELRKVIRFLQLIVNERDFRNVHERKKIDGIKRSQEGADALGNFMCSIEEKVPEKKPNFKLDFF
ncbi:hypothetical protein ACFLZN_02715 [Nanoarchaeota archaeon]